MKIKVLFNGSYPVGTVSTHRVHHLCQGMVLNGMDVELVIVHPTEQSQNIRNHQNTGVFEQVRYRYISSTTVRKKNLFLRKIWDLYYHIQIILEVLMNRDKSDIVLVIGPSLDFRSFLPLAALFNQSKIFLEINEYPFFGTKGFIPSPIKRFIWFHCIVPMYDGFVVISDALDQLMKKYAAPSSSNINIPILGDFMDEKKNFKSMLDVPYMIHAGSLHESKDGIMGVLKAYKKFIETTDTDLKFVITGNTRYSEHNKHIHQYIQDNHLSERIVFTGFISTEDMENYLKGSAFAIINKYDNLQNRYCFSTKLADYLKFEVPIIITTVGEAQAYLKDEDNAYFVKPGDEEALVNAMTLMLHDQVQAKRMAQKGYQLIEKEFNHVYQGQILKTFFSQVLEKSRVKL